MYKEGKEAKIDRGWGDQKSGKVWFQSGWRSKLFCWSEKQFYSGESPTKHDTKVRSQNEKTSKIAKVKN